MVGPRRDVFEEPSFVEARARLSLTVKRVDEIIGGVLDLIQDHPEIGKGTDDADIRGIATRAWPDAAPLVLYYRFDATTVYLVDLVPVPDA